MRVNVQLIDAETGNHLWAERFDKPLADLFEYAGRDCRAPGGRAEHRTPLRRGAARGTGPTRDSMDLYFQRLACFNKGPTPDNVAQARGFFDRALSADPDNVDALIEFGSWQIRSSAHFCL